MTVDTVSGSWVVPPHRAAWIPASFEHALRTTGRVKMRTLYLRPDLIHRLPESCCVINVAPLLRELILETLKLGMLFDDRPVHARLAGVLLDQLAHVPAVPLQIKLPSDERALRVADRARLDLSAVPPIAELAESSGASVRTIERLFVNETGFTFGRWLRRVKALHAVEQLAAGNSVVGVGLAVGYSSTSAFIEMFKRILGKTPGSYFSRAQ